MAALLPSSTVTGQQYRCLQQQPDPAQQCLYQHLRPAGAAACEAIPWPERRGVSEVDLLTQPFDLIRRPSLKHSYMKTLFAVLAMLPMVAIAQENSSHSTIAKGNNKKWEAGWNNGLALSLKKGMTFYDDAFLVSRNTFSLYRNFSSSQIGLRIEGGYSPLDESWYISPEIVVNKSVNFKHMYLYGGGGVGYKRIENSFLMASVRNGYTTALQAGIVYHLSKHISINVEVAVKSEQMWLKYTYSTSQNETVTHKTSHFDVYLPVAAGLRYRF